MDPGFRVESVHQAAPFRARTTFTGYQAFGEGSRAVLVEPQTAGSLRDAAHKAYPKETGGLLCGRTLRDHGGQYVLVSGFVQAGPGAGRSAAFEISPQQTEELRQEAHRASPTADVVGWWHSHPAVSSYSQTDLGTQAIFSQPDSVGLLVFARGDPWAMAYMGPQATELGYSTEVRATARPAHAQENGQVEAESPADRPVMRIPDPPVPRRRTWTPADRPQRLLRLVIFTEAALIMALLVIILVAIVVSGLPSQISSLQRQVTGQVNSGEKQVTSQVGSMQQQLSDQINGAARLSGPSVSFACAPMLAKNGQFSNYFTCTATPSVSAGEVLWYLDGKEAGHGNAFQVKAPLTTGVHRVQAILKTSGGQYPAPVQQLP